LARTAEHSHFAGGYNYIRETGPEIDVWVRYFRKVDDVHYYGDFNKDARAWQRLTMTETITPLARP
jgi:hypothetical protein